MKEMLLLITIALTYLFTNAFASVFEYPFFDTFAKWQGKGRLEGDYSAYILKNKLKVILHEHDDRERPFEAALTVGVGSSGVSKKHPVWEQPILEGLPHLLEHLLLFSNEGFPSPNGIHKFMTLSGGYANGITWADHTIYELQIPHGDYVFEALKRFVSMFISPIFTKESIQTEKSIVNNEWLEHRELTRTIYERYPQLLMTKDAPSALFSCGDSTSLNGDADVLLDQVKLFWKTHYTADNMKLAISFHRSYKNDVLKILTEFFERIPTSISENTTPPLNSNPTPFWSEDHKDQYLEVYTQNERRNLLHLYWHIPCNEGAVCHDSLEMIVQSIQVALPFKFSDRIWDIYYRFFSPNDYVVSVTVVVRDVELSEVPDLKERIIKTIRDNAPGIVIFNESHVGFSYPQYLAKRLSEIMRLKGPLAQVPIRAHVMALVDESTKMLNQEHWDFLKKDPRVALTYKSSFFKNALARETLLFDPYYSLYYQYVDNYVNVSYDSVALHFEPSDSGISLKITHPTISYPFQFLRGIFIETIRIILKDRLIKFQSSLGTDYFNFDIYFEDTRGWRLRIKEVMEALASPTYAVFKKAKARWLREMRSENSFLSFENIALQYANALLSPYYFDSFSLLISDPNPRSMTLEKFRSLRHIFQTIGTLEVTPHRLSTKKISDKDIINGIQEMWMSGVPQSKYSSKYLQPARGETFIYAPPPLLTARGGVVIMFEWDMRYINYITFVKNILNLYFYERLRSDMKLTYSPKVDIISGNYLYIMVPSSHTPDYVQNRITSVIKEIPQYIRGLSEYEWIGHVKECINEQERWVFFNLDGREKLVEMVEYCMFEERGSSRVIFQFWGKDQREAREEYLGENREMFPCYTKIIRSIEFYPCDNEIFKF